MQAPQNGRRFGSTRGPQNFRNFFMLFQKHFYYFQVISYTQIDIFLLKYISIGGKVRFGPIVKGEDVIKNG